MEVVMANPNAVFTKMKVTFTTGNDDKDYDTFLEIWINKIGEHQAAYASVDHQHYDNNSVNTVDVPPKENQMLWSEIPGSWIQIRIHPNGNDTWRFSFVAVLSFSDGSTLTQKVDNAVLDQDSTQGNYPLGA
jgi:hypothetical protein